MTIRNGLAAGILCTMALACGQPRQQSQSPAQQPQNEPPRAQQPETQRTGQATVTIAGCLQEERNVPGAQPNAAGRAGAVEGFILTDASMQGQQTAVPGAPGQSNGVTGGTSGATGTSGAVESSGTRNMYRIEGLDQASLRLHVGQRVEITGHLQPSDRSQTGAGATGTAGTQDGTQTGTYSGGQGALPQIQADSIREISGSCPSNR